LSSLVNLTSNLKLYLKKEITVSRWRIGFLSGSGISSTSGSGFGSGSGNPPLTMALTLVFRYLSGIDDFIVKLLSKQN
ncbi:MAG: hypothetical protein VW871_05900, partial [Gammaproteobacteria bacterium]